MNKPISQEDALPSYPPPLLRQCIFQDVKASQPGLEDYGFCRQVHRPYGLLAMEGANVRTGKLLYTYLRQM